MHRFALWTFVYSELRTATDGPREIDTGFRLSSAGRTGSDRADTGVDMVTGDSARTARAISCERGIEGAVVTGAGLDDRALGDRVEEAVFARTTP